ncbi:MAG: hypothetical protein ACYDER_01435 [Ktedonobacteraceae bacterium]
MKEIPRVFDVKVATSPPLDEVVGERVIVGGTIADGLVIVGNDGFNKLVDSTMPLKRSLTVEEKKNNATEANKSNKTKRVNFFFGLKGIPNNTKYFTILMFSIKSKFFVKAEK